jgi:hypothetical protein
VAALAVVGGALLVTGTLLPWLSFFVGLQTYRGITGLYGQILLAGGAASVLGGLVYVRLPRPAFRWGLGLLGGVLFGFAAWLVVQLLAAYRDLGADPFVFGRLGPGLFVSTLGAALVLATLIADPLPTAVRRRGGGERLTLEEGLVPVLAFLSASAGIVHFAVLGQHLGEWVVFGAFFAFAGSFQVAWALLLPARRSRAVYLVGAGANASIVVVWAVSRTLGLPFGPEPGVAETVGFPDVFATACEATLIAGIVAALLRGRAPLPGRSSGRAAAAVFSLALVVLTVAAALDAVGAASILPLA